MTSSLSSPSLSADSLPDAGLPDLLAEATAAGFDAVHLLRHRTEASLVHPDWSVRRIREALADAKVTLPSCGIRPLTGRKADSDERYLAYNLRQLSWDAHLCRALGVSTLTLCAGAATPEAAADLREGLASLAESVPDVTFAVAPAPETCVASAADVDALLPDLPESVRVCLDTGVLLAAGDDPVAAAVAWGERLGLVVARDLAGGSTVLPGDGSLDVDGLRDALQAYTGPLVVEAPSDGLAEARQRLTA